MASLKAIAAISSLGNVRTESRLNPPSLQEHSVILEPFQDETNWLDVLVLLSQRKRFIGVVTASALILTIVIVLLIPNEYTAETLILPPSQNSSMSSVLLNQMGGSGALASIAGAGLGIKNPGDMYVSLFRGRGVEDAEIQRFGLMARYHEKRMVDARRAFEEHSTVILGVKDSLIRITVRDRDPGFAAQVANGYVEEFRKQSASLAITEASQRRTFFQQQLVDANKNLASAEEALKQTQQTTGILQIDSQARMLIESAATLRAQLAAKEVQLEAMRAYATDNNPDVLRIKDEIAALHSQLTRLAGSNDGGDADLMVTKGKIPGAGLEYLRKFRDVKYFETIYGLIAKQLEIAKLDEAREGSIIQVVDLAVAPDRKSSPHRALIVILMTLIGLFAASIWVLGVARWRRMLDDPENGAKAHLLKESFSASSRWQA